MKGARILLLDDNREARWPLASCLRSNGAVVTEADDGIDGMRLIERNEYDLVIADVCMPRMGGFGLFSELRFGDEDSLPYRNIPVILVTGEIGRSELARGLEAGLEDFVTKPVDLDEFRARVKSVLRRTAASARPTARTQGDLRDLRMSALTQALNNGCSSGRLCIRSGTAFGLIDFQRGHISHAIYTAAGYELTGDEAAMMALGMEEGTFEILPVPESAPRTVFADTQSLLLRAATHSDEVASGTVRVEPVGEAAGPRPNTTIVLTPLADDDEAFLADDDEVAAGDDTPDGLDAVGAGRDQTNPVSV